MFRLRMRLWKIEARIRIGMTLMVIAAPAASGDDRMKNSVVSARGYIWASVPNDRISAKVNSFQEARNAITVQAASPGAADGTMTRRKAPQRVQPSALADASSPRGSDANSPVMIQTISGTVAAQ